MTAPFTYGTLVIHTTKYATLEGTVVGHDLVLDRYKVVYDYRPGHDRPAPAWVPAAELREDTGEEYAGA